MGNDKKDMVMKVLFVSREVLFFEVSPLIKNQGESLKNNGVNVDYFKVSGKGILGYLRSIPKLKKRLNNNYDLIHAHYSLSAFVASLAGAKPLVVSLMGSDVNSNFFYRFIIRYVAKIFWSATIVKSELMKNNINIKGVYVIPNGIDLEKFKPINRSLSIKETGWESDKKHILFAANPNRPVKNYDLAQKAYRLLNKEGIEFHYLDHVLNDKMPFYYNASDTVLLTSFSEGSPNVIKEAMACNVPIVSTDVGDVKEIINSTSGCYIANFDPNEISVKLKKSVFKGKTNGRIHVKELNSKNISKRIISIYKKVIQEKKE